MRGVVTQEGAVVLWPTLLADHNQVFAALPHLRDYRLRWRQWAEGAAPDCDPRRPDQDAATYNLDVLKVRATLHEAGCLPYGSHGKVGV
jgi:hypothetical protein